ncbi:hypothetical protein HPP92_009537 [Vanilla planifolia]|uniref:CUE domain-containing protein n=1 Tax=Vanilla planifolia TaxID=51239 RepID=A0A835R827_VANPL|nr:hypothetical protein HPP92_009537 [Vanilla planifolia]
MFIFSRFRFFIAVQWQKNDSLHQFLDSYLQFRSRWYDFPHRGSRGVVAGVIVGEVDLCRRVFFVLYRISSNRDPGANASDSLSVKDHTALLQEKRLLDLPKLLDICAIYGHENAELTKLLVTNAIKAQPQLLDNLSYVVSHFLSIVHTMHERCSTSLEVLASSSSQRIQGSMQLSKDLLEVMDFVNDAIMTFDAFIDACKPSAMHLSASFETRHGNEELLRTLAKLHDSLIPSMLHGFSLFSAVNEEDKGQKPLDAATPEIFLSLKTLSMRIVRFGWKLLELCYLDDKLTEDNLLQSASKIFPASVEDPSIRGDIIVQMLKEINGAQHQLLQYDLGTFIENLEKNFKLFGRINRLCNNGWISLEDEQMQYLSLIMKSSSSSSSSSAVNMQNTSHTNQVQVDEETILLDSRISQIKDLFPDYGKGFLKACLEVYNNDVEVVIQRILEGTLHEDLSSLDISSEQIIPHPSKQIPHKPNDKGKGLMLEPPSSSSLFGRYTRKSSNDVPDTETLNNQSAKDSIKSAILATELEYDDEYDDSFDDLGSSPLEPGDEESENLNDQRKAASEESSGSRWISQKKPQFYVKDGKNYSYKVSGSVGVSSAEDAALFHRTQKGLIHGLGRGGNVPLEAARKLEEVEEENQQATVESSDRGITGSRGRGRRGAAGNHYRKDRAMKKHFSGLSGY